MVKILEGLRIVEGSAFVAAPLAGMTLAQMGADVIRFDRLIGGLDYQRWPVTSGGPQPVLGRPQQGQAQPRGRYGDAARARGRDPPHLRARRAGRHLPHQPARARLDGLRRAEETSRRSHHDVDHRRPARRPAGRLHHQPRRRLPDGDRPGGLQGAGRARAAGVGLHHRPAGGVGHSGGRAPPARDRRRPVGRTCAQRHGARHARQSRPDRRGRDQRRRPAEIRQFALRRLFAGFPLQGRRPGHRDRPHHPAMGQSESRDAHAGRVRRVAA